MFGMADDQTQTPTWYDAYNNADHVIALEKARRERKCKEVSVKTWNALLEQMAVRAQNAAVIQGGQM